MNPDTVVGGEEGRSEVAEGALIPFGGGGQAFRHLAALLGVG